MPQYFSSQKLARISMPVWLQAFLGKHDKVEKVASFLVE